MNFMKAIFYATLIGLTFLTISCGGGTSEIKKSDGLLKHRIIDEEVYDAALKAQVSFSVLIDEADFDESELRELLNYLYDKTKSRSRFEYYNSPTNIFIWAYSNEEKAKSGKGQWVGMISKSFNDTNPKINISDTQFKALNEKQEEKWNLNYETRQEIWTKLIMAERKAQNEADKEYPLDKPGITQDDMFNNVDLMRELKGQYEIEIARNYNLDSAILDSVSLEGVMNGWAFPER